MYHNNKKWEKERREDIERLWRQLHEDDEHFSENIDWFWQKAIDSDSYGRFETMFAEYLEFLIKVDNKLFVGRGYWDIESGHVDRTYRLLLRDRYAEKIVEIALGTVALYDNTKHKSHRSRIKELFEIAVSYQADVLQIREKCNEAPVKRAIGWKFMRRSNRVFAQIYDIVEYGITSGAIDRTYEKLFAESSDRMLLHKAYMDAFDRLLEPRKYKWKMFVNKIKPAKKNKRKKIN